MENIIISLSMQINMCETGDYICIEVLDPDLGEGYAGEQIHIDGRTYLYRSYKSWIDLAELLMCKIMTPEKSTYPLVKLYFKKLEIQSSFHTEQQNLKEEKYGINSHFSQINKMEEPAFLYYYKQALQNAKLHQRRRVLNLGINTGDEFNIIKNTLDKQTYKKINLVGIDHTKTAITYAAKNFP